MTQPSATRVAVYFDFDNIVISRYDQVHGRAAFQKDKANGLKKERLQLASVDIGAIMDFASSFGTLVLTRAYADWSTEVNARYHRQLVAAPSISYNCSRRPRTARTGPTSVWRSTPSRTCSGCPT